MDISLHHNPTTQNLHINGLEGTAFITISDIHCVVSIKKQIVDGESISLKLLKKGIYIVKIVTSNCMIEKILNIKSAD